MNGSLSGRQGLLYHLHFYLCYLVYVYGHILSHFILIVFIKQMLNVGGSESKET